MSKVEIYSTEYNFTVDGVEYFYSDWNNKLWSFSNGEGFEITNVEIKASIKLALKKYLIGKEPWWY